MSLYSSLTQVLAPFAAKINGLLTGWDGTKYSTPGEAVRQQISDLHVLIGDIQGDAKIAGSAVKYEGDALSATNMQDAVDELSDANTALNGRLQQYGDAENLFTETAENVKTWSITGTFGVLANANARTIVIPCAPGMRYRIRKNAGGRFIVGDFHTYPSAGMTLTNGAVNNNATEIVYTTSRNAQYLVAFVYYASTDGSDYQTMLDSIVIERATAEDIVARKITESIQSGGHTFAYNADLSLLTNEGTGRYFLGEAFPAGNVKSIQLYMKANSEVHFGLYTLENDTLTIARWLVAKSTEDGLVTVPVEATALHPFYVQIYVVSGKALFRSNGKYDVYGVTAYADTYEYPLPVGASHYEFGVNVIYTYTKEYEPLGKNWLLIGDSYLEGYSADGNVTSWGQRIKQFLGLDYNTVIAYKGGVGFIPYDFGSGEIGFESLALNANVPDPNTITHVVVCGGYNDAVRSASQGEVGILNRIESFVTNVSAKYPNAKIYIGMIGYRNNDSVVLSRIRGAGLRAYQTSVRYGTNDKVRYLNNVEWTLVASDMSSDGYHPNSDGQYKLGMNIKNALLTGSAPILSFARDEA